MTNKKSKPDVLPLPQITSLSLQQVPGGWSVLTIVTQGDTVVSVEATPPDMKAIATEHYRIRSAQLFMS